MDSVFNWMDGAPIVSGLPPLLVLAIAAVILTLLGGLIGKALPMSGRLLRWMGNFALLAIFAVTVLRFVQLDPKFDGLAPRLGMPVQTVAGGETRVRLSSDGHYWIEADVDGTRQRFMVDTGATLTAISQEAATKAGIEPDPMRLPVIVRTANGSTQAQMARIDELRFGSIVARDLDAIVTGATGGLNVLGMNFLSRLKGWRVEDGVLILTPRPAEPVRG